MKQWYCVIGGKRYGPVAEEQLKQWIAERRLQPGDLVWTEGMPEWAPASSIPELGGETASLPLQSPGAPPRGIVPPPTGGTGGCISDGEVTAQARSCLSGRWGLPIGFSLLLGLLQGACQNIIPSLGWIAALVLGGPFVLGGVIFYLTFTRGGQGRLGMMFEGFRNFGNALGVYILSLIFIFLWLLLLIIPGIIASFAYSQAMYLIADDPTLGPLEAIRKSKEMMKGHKSRLFMIHLRMFGWALVCILTLGIGFLWLGPYTATSLACFYNDLIAQNPSAAPVTDTGKLYPTEEAGIAGTP